MKFVLVISVVLGIAFSQVICDSGSVRVRFIKQNKIYSYMESFTVRYSSMYIFSSPGFVDGQRQFFEACLYNYENYNFHLEMMGQGNNGWYPGAWLEIQGIYGNTLFKGALRGTGYRTVTFNAGYAIYRNDYWKYKVGSVPTNWMNKDFSDTAWTGVTLGYLNPVPIGTQYYRKSIYLSGVSAYELRLKYKFGIVAFMNGVEILRDNMPEGPISANTMATGSYSVFSEHAFLRNAYEVGYNNAVLAVEIHALDGVPMTTIELDGWMALYGYDGDGYGNYYPNTPVTIVATNGNPLYPASNIFDWDEGSLFQSLTNDITTVTYTFQDVTAQINCLNVYADTHDYLMPRSFLFSGIDKNNHETVLYTGQGVFYDPYMSNTFAIPFNRVAYQSYKFTLLSGDNTYFGCPEVRPGVCYMSTPTELKYTPNVFTLYTNFEGMKASPKETGFTSCSISPSLPIGITLSPLTCIIEGTPSEIRASTVYTITSTVGDGYSTTVTITSRICNQNMIRIKRTYKNSPTNEIYSITNSNDVIVYDEARATTQVSNSIKYYHICVPNGRYKIVTDHTSSVYWASGSYVELYLIIDITTYEQILRMNFDNNLRIENTQYFNSNFLINSNQNWYYYRTGIIPIGWTGINTDGWIESKKGSFINSVNQIQLYKKTFTVGSLSSASAFSISLRFLYGCIVYMNDIEVYRHRVVGDLTSTTKATGSYSSLLYRFISFPVTTFVIDTIPAVTYLREGSNRIAIAIVGSSEIHTISEFDCVVMLINQMTSSRIFDYTVSYSGSSGTATSLWNDYYGNSVYNTGTACTNNENIITFADDRREWIGSYMLQATYNALTQTVTSFTMMARNGNEQWIVLDEQEGWKYWVIGQEKKVYLRNNQSFNQYKFVNFKNDGVTCAWKVNRAVLYTDKADIEAPDLIYESFSVYRDVEMAEVYPSSELYTRYSVKPALPNGLYIDPPSGVILGTPTVIGTSQTYTITAYRYSGVVVNATVNIGVEICTGGKSLMTVNIRTDSNPLEVGYILYEGRGDEGEIKLQKTSLPSSSTIFYVDYCAIHSIYTIKTIDTKSTGWTTPAGFWLSVDKGQFVYELNQMPALSPSVSILTSFSSLLPFQIEHDNWKVYKNSDVNNDWMTLAYNDDNWSIMKADRIGLVTGVTCYIRHSVTVPNLHDYSILNIRVKYGGGLIAYFNGRKVARFYLPDEVTTDTPATQSHDSTVFSQFSIILNSVGSVIGNNMIAFELHHAEGVSSSTPVVFDATGVYGVNDCSPILNSFLYINSTSTSTTLMNLFDMNPTTTFSFINSLTFYIQWKYENLEPVRFNAYSFQPGVALSSFGFTLYSRELDEDDWNETNKQTAQRFVQRVRIVYESSGSMLGHSNYKFMIDDTASTTPNIYEMMTMYCKADGEICPGIDDYPPVVEGEVSPSVCPIGYIGYTYRICTNGKLSTIKTDKCRYKIPKELGYKLSTFNFILDTKSTTGQAFYKNIIENFYLDSHVYLPTGLVINPITGEIVGIPETVQALTEYTIYGKNGRGTTSIVLNISVREGICLTDGFFETTKVGRVAQYDCSKQGSFVGTQKRACLLDSKDGEWQKITGMCISIAMIVLLIIIAIIIVVIVVIMAIRSSKRVKAVGGVKDRKKKSPKKVISSDHTKVSKI